MKKILVAASMMLLGTMSINAAGTTAGIDIVNSATLSYSAGGTSQPDVGSNTDTFKVDKKIDMILVTTDTDQQPGALGQEEVITHFTFTNEGNADQNFSFSVANLGTGEEADYNANADSNDMLALVFDCNSSGTWTAEGSSILIQVGKDETFTCEANATIPSSGSAVDGDIMNIELLAVAKQADGTTDESNTTTGDTADVDVVLADGTVDSTLGESANGKGDSPQDGQEAARSGYIVKTPVLDLTKISCVYNDPINDTTDPKRIPGATILYVFDINNTGTLDANEITISDDLVAELDGGSVTNVQTDENATITPCACTDGAHYTVGGTAGTNTNSGSGQNVKVEHVNVGARKHTCVSFEVIIN